MSSLRLTAQQAREILDAAGSSDPVEFTSPVTGLTVRAARSAIVRASDEGGVVATGDALDVGGPALGVVTQVVETVRGNPVVAAAAALALGLGAWWWVKHKGGRA
jgi:hypothetical protein